MLMWLFASLAIAVLCGGTEVDFSTTFRIRNSSDPAVLAKLNFTIGDQPYPGGMAEKSCAYLDRVFDTKNVQQFKQAWLTQPSLMPNSAPYDWSGIYMFSFKCQADESILYPIYIGITGLTFRQRMMAGHTVLSILSQQELKVPSGCGDIRGKIYWTLVASDDVVTSKVIESVFLATFNFALNTDENRKFRTRIYQLNPQKPYAFGHNALLQSLTEHLQHTQEFINKEKLTS